MGLMLQAVIIYPISCKSFSPVRVYFLVYPLCLDPQLTRAERFTTKLKRCLFENRGICFVNCAPSSVILNKYEIQHGYYSN